VTQPLDVVKLEVRFPLSDGRTLVQGPLAYNQDGLATQHNADFMRDPRFLEAYRVGMENARPGTQVEWRVHVALWCATRALQLQGDFVECGVHTGILSGAVMTWLDFAKHSGRKFYLFDTWQGIPPEQISEDERRFGVLEMNRKYQDGDATHAAVMKKFSRWPNAVIVRGRVPDTLAALADSKAIAYASIDMNVAAAEMQAAAFLWPRLVPGALVLLDDYGWAAHANQKKAWDGFAQQHDVMILALPSGQGLIVKP
jgi:O-methyltransferase